MTKPTRWSLDALTWLLKAILDQNDGQLTEVGMHECLSTFPSHTGVESGFSRLWYGVRVVQSTLQALFLSTITGVVVQDFRSCSVPVTHKGYLVESCRSLWFGSSPANRSVFNTLSRHSPLAAVSRSTSIISLRLGSIASLSSPFSSSCYVGSYCSAFLFC